MLNIGPGHGLKGSITTVQSSIIGSTPLEQSNVITSNDTDLTIRLRLQRLDMSSRELTALIDLKVSDRFKEDLWDSADNTTIADSESLILKTKYENYMIPIEIRECSTGSSTIIQIPLKSLFAPINEICPQPSNATEIILPVTGRPRLYPEDWYLLNASFALPWNGAIFPGHIKPAPDTCTIPPEIEVFPDVGLSNKYIGLQQYPSSCGGTIQLLITSDVGTRAYTWTILLIPIILLFIFIHVLYINPETRKKSISSLIAAAVAAIIAVLPLRIVLVPPEISGLTCVDLILALGMSSIFALIIITYGFEIRGKASKKERGAKKER
jgi:hypothetical protein